MKRKATVVGSTGPKSIVQQIAPTAQTIPGCPLCKSPFKEAQPTVLVDLVKRVRLTTTTGQEPEFTVRIHMCEQCAQPVIQQKQEAMDRLIKLLTERAVDTYSSKRAERLTKDRSPLDDAREPSDNTVPRSSATQPRTGSSKKKRR